MSAISRTIILRNESNAQSLWSLLKQWRAMATSGNPLAVYLDEYKAKRTPAQNRRMWAILREIEESGWYEGRQYSQDGWHEFFKRMFIGLEEVPGGGSIGISTTTLNVEEFAAYMTRIEAWAAQELGIEFTI